MTKSFFIIDYEYQVHRCKITATFVHIKSFEKRLSKKHGIDWIQVIPWQLKFCLNELEYCPTIRKMVINKLVRIDRPIVLQIIPPDREVIDYKWNQITMLSIWQKVETEVMMSWLSTLGGAFSTLGDSFDTCAEMAGKISIYQLKLALAFGDPIIVCRSKLYYSLSLLQKGYLRSAKYLIRQQFEYAKSVIEIDDRLLKMCHGIWLKLQYSYTCRKLKKNKATRTKT